MGIASKIVSLQAQIPIIALATQASTLQDPRVAQSIIVIAAAADARNTAFILVRVSMHVHVMQDTPLPGRTVSL